MARNLQLLCKLCLLAGLVLNYVWNDPHLVTAKKVTIPVTQLPPRVPTYVPTARNFLEPHNAARARVKVAPLQWNATLAAYALAHGQKQRDRSKCEMMEHSNGGPGYGENLFWGSHLDITAEWAVGYWISEREFYNYAANRCEPEFEECGHYTQIVWRNSSQVGCAAVPCHDASVLMVCEYFPPGNVAGMRPF